MLGSSALGSHRADIGIYEDAEEWVFRVLVFHCRLQFPRDDFPQLVCYTLPGFSCKDPRVDPLFREVPEVAILRNSKRL